MMMKGDMRKKNHAVRCVGSRLQKGERGGRRQVVGTKAAMPVREGVGSGCGRVHIEKWTEILLHSETSGLC